MYLYILEQVKRENTKVSIDYFDVRDSILMAVWNQMETEDDIKMMKYFGDVCYISADSTAQVMKTIA